MDKNGIMRYLVFVFVLGYAVQIGGLASGLLDLSEMNFFHWIILILIMFIPAFSAVAALLSTPEHERDAIEAMPQVWPIPIKSALLVALIVPVVFGIIYGLAWLLNLQEADFAMHEAIAKLRAMSPQPLPENSASMVGYLMLSVGLPISVLMGATLFAVLGIGFEYGWRGYLLPRLIPLGRIKAYFITAILSYIWLFPLFFMGFGGNLGSAYLWVSLLRIFVFILLFSVALGCILERHQNLGLCAIFLGAFISQQTTGIWSYLFPMEYTPYTGPFGVIGLVCWLALALVIYRLSEKNVPKEGEAS